MKHTWKIIFGITVIALAGIVIYKNRDRNTGYMLSQVSDEGYETAHDVLFPDRRSGNRNLRFGPILPLR